MTATPSHRFMTALALATGLSFVAGPSIAVAQSAPLVDPSSAIGTSTGTDGPKAAPTTAPGGTTTGANTPSADDPPAATPSKKTGTKKARKFEHLELAPTLQYTMSSGSDVIPQKAGPLPNALPYDIYRLVGDARYRFNSHFGVQYQRISHTGGSARTYRKGVSNYPGSGYDYEERELATWAFNPLLTYRAGYHYRARVCCPGAGDPNGIPRFLGGFFTDLSWKFGPNGMEGKPLTTSFRYEQNYHRMTAAAQKNIPRGDSDSGQKPTFAYSAYANVYVYHQAKLVPYGGIEYFSTYFSNNPHMSVTYRKVYGVAYRATENIGWKFYIKNDQPNGLAAGGDATHKSTAFLEATYRFHR